MNLLSKKYIVSFSLILLLFAHFANACGPSLYLNDGRFSLFRNGLDGSRGLEPFYYSESFLNSYQPDPAGVDYKRNCEEWRKYCGSKVSAEDIYKLQYQADADTFLQALTNNDWTRYGDNTFLIWLRQSKHKEALDYFILSKKIEYTQFGDRDPWRENSESAVFSLMAEYTNTAKEHCLATKDKFLRERYAFQALKMDHYTNGNSEGRSEVTPLYNKYLKNSKSVIAGWAALFYGLQQPDNNKRTYYLLKAFSLTEEKKVFCYLNIKQADLDGIEQVDKSKETAELVCVFRAMKTFGKAFPLIKKLHEINPESKYLPLLISREINKIEDWIWSPDLLNFSSLGFDDEGNMIHSSSFREGWRDTSILSIEALNRKKDVLYLQQLRSFISQIKLKRDKDFKQLALAHLYNMTKDYEQAMVCLKDIKNLLDSRIETQKIIEWTIANAYTKQVTTKAFKDVLVLDLKRLYAINVDFQQRDTQAFYWGEGDSEFAEDRLERNDDFGELLLMLSNRYKEQGDILTAGLLYHKANILSNIYDGYRDVGNGFSYNEIAYFDRNASVKTMDELLLFIAKKDKSSFEQFILPNGGVNIDWYKDLKGTIQMRREEFHEALKTFSSVDTNYWQQNGEFASYLPKVPITSLGTLTPWVPRTKDRYAYCNKAFIVADIVRIQDSLKLTNLDKEQKANLHIRLGNCFFSMTYFGEAWMMMSYGQTSNEDVNDEGTYAYYSFYPNNIKYGRNYYGCEAAKKEYQLALSLSIEKETKASCLLSLTMCDNNSFYNIETKGISPYLAKLRKSYRGSKNYQIALTTCPDIATSFY